jgi:hypothetical protein
MKTLTLIASFVLSVTYNIAALAQSPKPPSQLEGLFKIQPYVRCDGFAEGVRGVKLDSRPKTAAPWREVSVGGTARRVSVSDGMRVMYAYPGTDFFANLKVERSAPDSYQDDKDIIQKSLAEIAQTDGSADVQDFVLHGFSGQTLTKRALSGSTLGITQLFSDEDQMIVTIYFLNQAPEKRRFKTFEEFVALRDGFVSGYSECVAKKRTTPLLLQ